MSGRLWPLLHEAELSELPEVGWLVHNHLIDGFTMMYGPPKTGKTFLALSMALSISSGHPWFGYQVQQAPVLYVSGEGAAGLSQRIRAWKVAEGVVSSQLYVVPFGARLVDREHVVGLRGDLHATGAKLLVVDTLARSMAGADENSAQDMGMAIQSLDWLREKTGCAVMVLHHSGASGERPRGSTALFGAVDSLIRVDGDGRNLQVTCEGQKDAPPFRMLSFELMPAAQSVALARRHKPPAQQQGFDLF